MKISPHLILAPLVAGTPLFAWPFSSQHSQGAGSNEQSRLILFQADADPGIECFNGGGFVLKLTRGAANVQLPLPPFDKTPYPAHAPVTFNDGRGAVGDIDGDGDIDVVRSAVLAYNGVNEGAFPMMACINNGLGVFTRGWYAPNPAGTERMWGDAALMELADFDRDGDLDLLENSPDLRIHWNPGNGDFGASVETVFTHFHHLDSMNVADFNGDGWPDIAVCFRYDADPSPDAYVWTGRLVVLMNEGGTFTATTVRSLDAHLEFSSSAAEDVDGDGRPDLLVTVTQLNGEEALQWQRNTGDGFSLPAPLAKFPQSLPHLAVGDLDENGIPDIIISDFIKSVKWMRGTGGGDFDDPAPLASDPEKWDSHCIAVGDADGDGDNDVVGSSGDLLIWNNAIHRGSGAEVSDIPGTQPTGSVHLATADMNHDGKPDLVVADGGGNRLLWYPGTGAGFSNPYLVSTGGNSPKGIAAGDFNRDGFTDIAWTNNGLLRQAISTNGSGISWHFSTIANMSGIGKIIAADADHDGDLDLLSMSEDEGLIRWHKNNGTASSWLPENVGTGFAGLKDIAVGQEIPGRRPEVASVSITGSGNGFFHRHRHNVGSGWTVDGGTYAPPGGESKAVLMADLDREVSGLETVFALNSQPIQVLHRLSTLPASVGSGELSMTRLAATDWTGDGHTDLLVATNYGVLMYTNPGRSGGSSKSEFLLQGKSIQDIVIVDVNRDGLPDAVVSEAETGKLRLITNRSAAMEVNCSASGSLSVIPGSSAKPFSISAFNAGWSASSPRPADAPSAPAYVMLRFLKTKVVDGVESPAEVLTQSEVSALIERVSITRKGATLAWTAPNGIYLGNLLFVLPQSAIDLLTVTASTTGFFDVELTLKPTAGSSSVKRFYVEYFPTSAWVALDTSSGTKVTGPTALSLKPKTIPRALVAVTEPTSLDQWRMSHFGTYDKSGFAGNDFDYDGDGVPNLLEYFHGTHPKVAERALNQALSLTLLQGPDTDTPVSLRVFGSTVALNDPKLRVTIQYATHDLGNWSTYATHTGGGSWIGVTLPSILPPVGGRSNVFFTTTIRPKFTPKYFVRLNVEELP